MDHIEIDQEFQALCPPLQPEEREQLETSLRAEGCRDALIVWQAAERAWCEHCEEDVDITYRFDHHPYRQEGDDREGFWLCYKCYTPIAEEDLTPVLLDGHNRYALCQAHELPFNISYQWQLSSREEAINWIIANQLGRRNLTEENKSYLRGKRYNLEKHPPGRPPKLRKTYDISDRPMDRLAQQYGVSAETIQNDGRFATAVDTLEAQVRQDIRATILHRKANSKERPSKEQVTHAATLIQKQTVEPQPFMRREGWKPYQVLEAIEVLGTLPVAEHHPLNALLDQPFIPAEDGLKMLKNLQGMASEDRQRVCQLAISTDPRDRSDAKALAAKLPIEPDPQMLFAQRLITDIDKARSYQRHTWSKNEKYKHVPWANDLDTIDTILADTQDRWRAIAARVKTAHTERIARYGRPDTA